MIPKKLVLEVLDRLFSRFEEQYNDAEEHLLMIKKERVRWNLIMIRMVRKEIERIPEDKENYEVEERKNKYGGHYCYHVDGGD